MVEANRFRLGLFVVTGSALVVAALLALGLARRFQPTVRFFTIVDESVQGLEEGAAVKFKGVTIGRVRRIAIRNAGGIRIDMEAVLGAVDWEDEETEGPVRTLSAAERFHRFFRTQVEEGLRCQLQLSGLTGMKYVGIDYFPPDPDKEFSLEQPRNPRAYIPARPSQLGGALNDAALALERLSRVDFEGLVADMRETLETTRALVSDERISSLIENLKGTSTGLNEIADTVSSVLTPERLDGLVTEMDALTSRVSTLIDDLTGIAATVSDELAATPVAETVTELRAKLVLIDETAAQFGSAAAAVTAAAEGMDQVLDSAPAARAELTRTLVEMENTLAAIRAFVRYLDQDPSSLLRGKQAPSARD